MASTTAVLLNTPIVMEALSDFCAAQPPKDMLHYKEYAMEALTNPNAQGKLIQTLYDDIIRHSKIDFGKIGDSKGDLTRYYYYDPMYKCIDILNQLTINSGSRKDLQTLNRLHDLIIEKRDDFEFGYKFDVEFIQLTYELLVMGLYELINVCIYEYTDELKASVDIEFRQKNVRGKRHRLIVEESEKFIRLCEKGEWNTLMKSYKKNPSNFLGAGLAAGAISVATSPAVTVIAAIIAVMVLIRGLTYLFFYGSTKLSEYAKVQAGFIKKAIELDSLSSADVLEKQKRMLEHLEDVSYFIDSKINKTEIESSKALKESNKGYGKDVYTSGGTNDFDFA